MSKLFFHAYETETQLQFSPPPLLIPVCRRHVETPLVHLTLLLTYKMWLKQPLSFNTSNFLQAHCCWKNVELLWSPKEHNSTTRLAFEFKFHRLWFSTAFRTHSWWEMCPTASLFNQDLCQLHPFPRLYFNHRNDLHAQDSHFQSDLHLCISESISSASASHTQTIHLCNGHQRSSGSQCDSCWLLSRLLVSLALEVPNQLNSCSCHSSHHHTRYLDGTGKHKWELGIFQSGAPFPITQQWELPQDAQGQGRTDTTCHINPHQCVLLVYSHLLVVFCHSTNTSAELLKYGSCTSKVFIINLIINLHNWFPSWQQAGWNKLSIQYLLKEDFYISCLL